MAKGEKTETAAVAETVATPAKFVPTVLRKVSQPPLLKLRAGSLLYCKVNGAMEVSKPLKNAKVETGEDGKPKQPPTVMSVTDLETGEDVTIICGSVLVDTLNDGYPKDAYVGKCFSIGIRERKDSKKRSLMAWSLKPE